MPVPIRVVALLLAAGRARRFGANKLLVPLRDGPRRGTPLGVAALRNLADALGDVIVVVHPGDDALTPHWRAERATVVVAEDADTGLGASLAAGVRAAPPDAGVVVALADMPWIAPATIARVAAAIAAGASIAAPFCAGRRGHPVGFSPAHRGALVALAGDEGARAILEANVDAVTRIDVDDAGVLRDVDTPADL